MLYHAMNSSPQKTNNINQYPEKIMSNSSKLTSTTINKSSLVKNSIVLSKPVSVVMPSPVLQVNRQNLIRAKDAFSFPSGRVNVNNIGMSSSSSSNLIMNDAKEFKFRINAKYIYTGKIRNLCAYVEITNDRVMFVHLSNDVEPNRFNITIPYAEMTGLRYCFCGDTSLIAIQPIYESYLKFSSWLKTNPCRSVPENYIMINFEEYLDSKRINEIKLAGRESKPNLIICEINTVLAKTYLNNPNKTSGSRIVNNVGFQKPLNRNQQVSQEIILLDDDDEENDSSDKLKSNGQAVHESLLNKTVLRYPEGEDSQIILFGNDLNCLRDGQYINDNIMNFYLKYFQNNGNIAQEVVDKVHIFDALFPAHLMKANVNVKKRKFAINHFMMFVEENQMEATYNKVLKKWTRDIDIFSKDFLLMPFIKDSHWFLIIMCYVGNLIPDSTVNNDLIINQTSLKSSHSTNTEQQQKSSINFKKPAIFYMDSLGNTLTRNELTNIIFQYLSLELKEKRGKEWRLNRNSYKELYPKVPQQQNYYDCGLFVLEYMERFLKAPDEIYLSLMNNHRSLQQWFNPSSLHNKRAKIQQIILNLLPPEDAKKLESELVKVNLNILNTNQEEKLQT